MGQLSERELHAVRMLIKDKLEPVTAADIMDELLEMASPSGTVEIREHVDFIIECLIKRFGEKFWIEK